MSKVIRRVGYLRFGRFLEPLIEKGRFERLNDNLKRAGMDISVRAYLGSAIFSSLLVSVLSILFTTVVSVIIFLNIDSSLSVDNLIIPAILFGLIVGVMVGIIAGVITYFSFPSSGTILISIMLVSIVTVTITIIISFLIFPNVPPSPSVDILVLPVILTALFVGIMAGLAEYLPYLYFPRMIAQDRKILIEAGLPSTASYLSAMSSSGVPPDRLFFSLAGEESVAPEISKESKRITRDIEIFGYDILKAIRTASERSPSERFSKFLDGMSATVTSGGDLTFYLSAETKALMKLKEEETKEFIEQLGVLAEIFMIIGVVAPLFFVVIIAILAVISPDVILGSVIMIMLSYFIMPILLTVMILLVSTISREI